MRAASVFLLIVTTGLFAQAPAPSPEEAVKKADDALAKDPKNLALLLAAARARDAAYQFDESIPMYTRGLAQAPGDVRFLRFRGHRYVSTRKFDDAIRDLTKAEKIAPNSHDVIYHLGLAYYFKGDFAKAAAAYSRCMDHPTAVDTMLPADFINCGSMDENAIVGMSNWYYVSLRRAGKTKEAAAVLERIHEGMKVKDSATYLNNLMLYKGVRKEDEVFKPAELKGNTLPTVGYAVGNFALMSGNKKHACEMFRLVAADPNKFAFGYIGSEVELQRGTCK